MSVRALVLPCLAMLVSGLCAQPEQWLHYNTSTEPRSFNWVVVVTNPPPNLILPKLQSQPLFVRWDTPMDKSGYRWLCFDRTAKGRTYNVLIVDSNGNGRLDDDPTLSLSQGADTSGVAIFPPARVVFQTEDGPVTYHLMVRLYNFAEAPRVYLSSACWYEGTVDFSGKKYRLQLFDYNVNGAFNDIALDLTDADRIAIQTDKEKTQAQNSTRFLGRLVEVDGEFFKIEVAQDGAFVKVQRANNVPVGKVGVPATVSTFAAAGPMGHFIRKPVEGTLSLPTGSYEVVSWELERKDSKGNHWKLVGTGSGPKGRFTVSEGQATSLDVGEPVFATLDVSDPKNPRDPVEFRLNFEGKLGESITILRGAERPEPPKLILESANGAYRKVYSFQYG